jgi:hypothetical protein
MPLDFSFSIKFGNEWFSAASNSPQFREVPAAHNRAERDTNLLRLERWNLRRGLFLCL